MEQNEIKKEDKKQVQEKEVLDALLEYLGEAREYAREWQDKAKVTWDMIHGRDYLEDNRRVVGEAMEGARAVGGSNRTRRNPKQGRTHIHMNRVGLAQQQIKAQFKQGLMNFDKWLVVEAVEGLESQFMTDLESKRAIEYLTRDSDLKAHITDAIGIAAAENTLAVKLHTSIDTIKGPGGKKYSKIKTELIPLSIFNFFKDASGGDLYHIYETQMDKYKLYQYASDGGKEKGKPYVKEKVKDISPNKRQYKETEISENRGNETVIDKAGRRHPIVIHEFWCTVLDKDGEVYTWVKEDGSEMLLENVMITVANEECLLHTPKPNPRFNGESPFVCGKILRTNLNEYGKAPLYAGVEMNRAENKLMGSIIDAALKSQYNVNVVKKAGLANPAQIQGGLKPNQTLIQNERLAPGDKLVDSIQTGRVDQGAFTVLSEIQRSGAENMMSNEINLTGNLPNKQVRATEVVQSSNVINGLFEAMASDIEDTFIEPLATQIFHEFLQHAGKVSDEGLEFIFGKNKQRMAQFKALSRSERFEELAHGFRFRGKGLRGLAANGRQAQTLVNLFSMVAANPLIFNTFQRRGVDLVKMMDKIISGMQLDLQEFVNEEEADFAKMRQLIQEQALAEAAAQGQNVGRPGGQGANAPQGSGPSDTEPGSGAGA